MRKTSRLEYFSYLFLSLMVICVILPIALLVISSFTEEKALLLNGYTLFPKRLSLEAYRYILQKANTILRCYGNSIFYTFAGTAANLLISSLFAYALCQKNLPGLRFINFFVFFTVIFNGGLVPTYLTWTGVFHVKNSVWGQLLPTLLTNAMSILMMRTFFSTSIPPALFEAAQIDGAGHLKIYRTIILPLGKPILATMGLFGGLAYWNDWTNGLYYVTDTKLYNIQNYLYRLISDTQFLLSNSESSGTAASLLPATGVKMAIACIAFVPIICMFPFVSRYFKQGIMVGAVKG
ncbi:MAG: carbohydrate ABC transporter permease [Lachnospiraceae bacterium]|nr:carbohydrate ABC transporter permease [Lachnospiraceae bacterium]MBD5456152.1 carbohydrate ABC transporter permease [Lachnospiraceae bacterium]